MFKGIVSPISRELVAGLQLEKIKAGDMYTGVYNGFSDLDNELLLILASFIGLKIAQVEEGISSKAKDNKVIDVVNKINSLISNRSHVKLLLKLRKVLPSLLGYEYVGVYLHKPDSTLWSKYRSCTVHVR
eukprot:TRINITY_DN22958_c0_g1_i1.p1 TRINITY_DN22958_c0_g1~~TRINITY_DN22958_c0_g1_i1.p1  ORF type:complete len:130 (-),score=5.35 TRINITY_DN22958_c0_g1_i1:45-434(-)